MKITEKDLLSGTYLIVEVPRDGIYIGCIRNDIQFQILWTDKNDYKWYANFRPETVINCVNDGAWGFARNEKEVLIAKLKLNK